MEYAMIITTWNRYCRSLYISINKVNQNQIKTAGEQRSQMLTPDQTSSAGVDYCIGPGSPERDPHSWHVTQESEADS